MIQNDLITSYSQASGRRFSDGAVAGAWWKPIAGGRIECTLCPRRCNLKAGDRGFCFVRENRDGEMVLTTYGKSTGFCIDPIEKKPLNHFFPGTAVLSFGTAGCNLGCKFCQNWDISKSRQVERLSSQAEPHAIAQAAREHGCHSVAFTYNDPVIWAEYAIETAKACRQAGIKAVAVTAGYICPEARRDFFAEMDAANVDLKGFTEEFYRKITYSHLQPVLETIEFLKRETEVWFELTNLIIPDANDNPDEIRKMCGWIMEAVGDEVPLHFSAFHPDFRMMDRGRTPPETLERAYEIARSEGVKFVYVGNVHDGVRQSTYCPACHELLIERDWYQLGKYALDAEGRCNFCQTAIPGRFAEHPGDWGARRQPVDMRAYAELPLVSAISRSTSTARDQPEHNETIEMELPTKDAEMTSENHESQATAVANQPAAAQLLDLEKVSSRQRQAILKMAAAGIVLNVTEGAVKTSPEAVEDLAQRIVMGAFVTLKRGDILRGCCGVLGKPMPLGAAIHSAAARTAKNDQRMAAISPCELPYLSLDVTLMGPFKSIELQGRERAGAIRVGKHGLMIQKGKHSGLLLPSVALERQWDAERFLAATCNKAGLPQNAWESTDTQVFTFVGETFSAELAEHLPEDLPQRAQPPLTSEQVSAYAQLAGQNIVALATGGTPSYVATHLPDVTVNAIVLSMQWGKPDEPESQRQANALQVSFRPGVALQSTLFQMCQQAAAAFQQQRYSGDMQLGLTLGFDPALHGFGSKADLDGVDSGHRGLVISDARHCGFAYDPQKTPAELRQLLREHLPISSRDATVHSLHVLSTMPAVVSISQPQPLVSTGDRPPAVAGSFYPAEDAARRSLVAELLSGESPPQCEPAAIMVPHAGLKYSGKIAAQVWRSVRELSQRTLVIVSPKHTTLGVNWSVCPFSNWRLSSTTTIAGDQELASQIAGAVAPLQLDAAAHQKEHGIEVQLPILERVAPDARVVGLALHGGSWKDIEAAAAQMAEFLRGLEHPPLLVISSDMNHYAPDAENRRRDRLALDAMTSGDPQQLIEVCTKHEISMCGLVPAAFVMETLRQLGHTLKVREVAYATSADASGDRSQVVGYAGVLIEV